MDNKQTLFLLILFLWPSFLLAQKMDNADIESLITTLKKDPRGPYKDIRWFCPDGSINPPKVYCEEEGGIQHARYKEVVEELGNTNHLYLGQILAYTDHSDFWDSPNNHSRLKQYQLQKYLGQIDDGWVLRKGQYYRGAFQQEDEQAWAQDFFIRLMANDAVLEDHFFLVRQAVKNIPHHGEDSRTETVWALSKVIAEEFQPFHEIRIKIHGQPSISDLSAVIAFKNEYEAEMDLTTLEKVDELITNLEVIYQPATLVSLRKYIKRVTKNSTIRNTLNEFVNRFKNEEASAAKLIAIADQLYNIREHILSVKSRQARLALLDLSVALEEIYFLEINAWQAESLEEQMEKICFTGTAATGSGFVEVWEWENIMGKLSVPAEEYFSIGELLDFQESAQRLLDWGTSMPRAIYQDVVEQYASFEPLALGFYDQRIRNSSLLNLGESVSELGEFVAHQAGFSNQVMTIENQNDVRGLNPGYALGELVLVEENESITIEAEKIYLFQQPPNNLAPVSGIAAVSQGNLVSHIQLLARNLGIPNASLTTANFNDLKSYAGEKVFYAVSPKGRVIMKPAKEMSPEEKALFRMNSGHDNRIAVPLQKLDLSQKEILNMREISAEAAGKICGPKAANLAQLKIQFPDKVVEGIVLPFGIFRQHMDQQMPGQSISYWDFLSKIFNTAEKLRDRRKSEATINRYVLKELAILREAMQYIIFEDAFYDDLENSFTKAFGKEIGEVPVFVRSDTNMEDLADFTGAGLNKTLFNVVSYDAILEGIREVWASPYTARSYQWRQRYLTNPENVFPSILIIPSVDVEYSGVLVTKGISNNDARDLTAAFCRGAGGAVDGQAAESWLLRHTGENVLLAPAREAGYRRLPVTGGTSKHRADFDHHILSYKNKIDLQLLAYEVYEQLADVSGIGQQGPYDIELGFKDDQIWLFQIRPFVENDKAAGSEYLNSINPKIDVEKRIYSKTKLEIEQNIYY